CATGLILGLAPGVHTALFILQLPLVLAFGWLWMRGAPRPHNTTFFAAGLLLATLAVALPSLALREGRFEFYTLSWFQVYFATCPAVLCPCVGGLHSPRRNLGVLSGVIAIMILPVIGQMLFAERFFTNAVAGMDEIGEVQSPWHVMLQPGGVFRLGTY